MSQFSVAPTRNDHHQVLKVGKDFPFSGDQMTMMNLLARGGNNQSNGVMKMPTLGSFRSSSHRRPHHRQATTNPHPHGSGSTTNSRFDSQDSSSSVVVGDESDRICGHQPMTVSSNQRSQTPTTADSMVTLWLDSQSTQKIKQPSDPRNVNLRKTNNHANSHKNSLVNNNNSNNSRMSTPGASSDQEDGFIKMKRQGSHDHDVYGNSNMSVTSALRSRAIAIHPNKATHPADLEEQHEQESVKIYDQATWRMYNRIVDHRRNQANVPSHGSSSSSSSQSSCVIADTFQTLQSIQALNDLNDLDNFYHSNNHDGDEDGGIFQLDL